MPIPPGDVGEGSHRQQPEAGGCNDADDRGNQAGAGPDFHVDLPAAVDEEKQPTEKEALSQLLDEFEYVFSRGV